MTNKYKVAVIGPRDAILPFKLIGFNTYPINDPQEAEQTIRQLSDERYGVIYITEDIAAKIPDVIREYDAVMVPAIILIPTHKGSTGLGLSRVQENVEKAIGSNIL